MKKQANDVVSLTGKKVFLRPPDLASDLEFFTKWINDEEVRQYITLYLPISKEQEAELFKSFNKTPENILFTVCLNSGEQIGCMGLHQINWKDRRATSGAFIGKKSLWGKGYGTDAKMALLDYAFNALNLHKICSTVIDYNERSLRYSLHCGYKEEGRLIKHIFKKGEYRDEILLGLFREDWEPYWNKYSQKK